MQWAPFFAVSCAALLAYASVALRGTEKLKRCQEELRQKADFIETLCAELHSARVEAATARRAKSEFLANLSHELRTPLNAIIGFSEVMLAQMAGPLGSNRYHAYARDINDSGHRLLEIINQLLDLCSFGTGTPLLEEQAVDLCELLPRCLSRLQLRADSVGISLRIDIAESFPLIRADEAKIEQALFNILSNAVKFTPRGGRVTLSGHLDGNGAVVLRVADTGIGMKPEDISRALEPFQQIDGGLSRKYGGLGLGLPLSKSIVERHDGRLLIVSELGKGTSVDLLLPHCRVIVPVGTTSQP